MHQAVSAIFLDVCGVIVGEPVITYGRPAKEAAQQSLKSGKDRSTTEATMEDMYVISNGRYLCYFKWIRKL